MKVKAIKAFQGKKSEGFVQAGQEIDLDVQRHRALAANGLVPHPNGEEPPASSARRPGSITSGDRGTRRRQVLGSTPQDQPKEG